ncbi:hypothetical protein PybrP1_008157 [[Pythium] brassicae (nom. inval.)]|nr:hypothetical protein PybrP1_008157 [[Pythium] brassicae (nom. inval.)]
MALLARITRRAAISVSLQMRHQSPPTALLLRPTALLLFPARHSAASMIGVRMFSEAKWGATNDDIRARVVQLVSEDGKMQENVPLAKALAEARRLGVDLVQVSETNDRVVCRMFDAKKRLFTMKKAVKQQKPKQDKEVVFGIKIETHDINVKVEHVKKFLSKGHKVKVTVKFAQQYHLKNKAVEMLATIEEVLVAENAGVPDAAPREQFGGMYTYIAPNQ